MDVHGWVALAILVVAAVLFLTRWLPLELTALGIPVALFLTGTLTDPAEALQGFGNHAVLAIASVFVLGAGLQESGVADLIARAVRRLGGTSETRLLIVISLAIAVLSAFMSNAATVAVLLPAVLALSRRARVPSSRLLMPMGFAAILGGNLTLIGTAPNLLVSDYLAQRQGEGFGMFDFALVGLPIVLFGILYMVVLGRHGLPNGSDGQRDPLHFSEQLVKDYQMANNLIRIRIGKASKLLGKSLSEAELGRRYGVTVVLVGHPSGMGTRWLAPRPNYRMERGDDLYLEGEDEAIWTLAEEEETRIGLAGKHHVDRVLDHGVALAEISVSPRSSVCGKTLKELDFRGAHGLSVLSIWRDGRARRQGVADMELEVGDALLVAGELSHVRTLIGGNDFIVLAEPGDVRDVSKAPLAVLWLLVAMLPPLLGLAPLAMSALAGALLMAGTGCVSLNQVGRFLEWKVLALIVGTLPLGMALEQHGVADLAASGLVGAAADLGASGVLSALFGLAALVSITSSNAAAAVILSPVAWKAAETIGLPPENALLAVAYGCSCAFLVPFAHQCNLMVVVPGGYRTKDFLLVGSGMSLVVILVAVVMLGTL
ncbi:MAG: hypothetical protein DWQ01_04955 [Planctomycetota bacterium]|nr:MAG: hypothetical protein DWQ01_04955 [Planctomycetota bacterium]